MTYRVDDIGTFFSSRNTEVMWDFVVTLTRYIAPGIMIVVAILVAGMMINLIVKAFKKGTGSDEEVRRNKETDEYEIKHY